MFYVCLHRKKRKTRNYLLNNGLDGLNGFIILESLEFLDVLCLFTSKETKNTKLFIQQRIKESKYNSCNLWWCLIRHKSFRMAVTKSEMLGSLLSWLMEKVRSISVVSTLSSSQLMDGRYFPVQNVRKNMAETGQKRAKEVSLDLVFSCISALFLVVIPRLGGTNI